MVLLIPSRVLVRCSIEDFIPPQINHLGHFLLTLELLPIITETAAASGDCRIVFVSSEAHARWGVFDPDNMNGEQSYGRFKFYGNSKLYNVRLSVRLNS